MVGWYLMLPPADAHWKLDGTGPAEPLGQWQLLGSFDTATQCKQGISDGAARFDAANPHEPKNPWSFAQCVASDDPRLKEK
jgi:hypothetical protein